MIKHLHEIAPNYVDKKTIQKRNKERNWKYGYDEEYDLIIISKDGTIGDIYCINSLFIALPETPKSIDYPYNKWVPDPVPEALASIKNSYAWAEKDNAFKLKWMPYINEQFDRRENGYWFVNKGKPTYITGSHYMYINFAKIDVGLPDFRESNRIFFIYWEACKADKRCFGMCYLKNRRSGFSFMASSEISNIGTISEKSKLGIQSKTGGDAKELFTGKVVPIVKGYPFFFRPIQAGNDTPRTELLFTIPASRITKKNAKNVDEDEVKGLDTTIDWLNTADNSYDGQKLLMLIEDESGKLEKPNNILNGWRVRKTCLRTGSRVIGKCMMGSTVNALAKGGENFKKLYYHSDPRKRDANGQTKSGLYSLFIPMDFNYEGHIDEYGHAVLEDPVVPTFGPDGEEIKIGSITMWNNEVDGKKGDPDELNEYYRQYPRTEAHAFRDESKSSIFNQTKLYTQIDYNDEYVDGKVLKTGNFHWKDGEEGSEVIFSPDPNGRFKITWIPPAGIRNNVIKKGGKFYPGNEELGAFGCDPYDISATVDGRSSKGALHGKTAGFSMNPDVPSNFFFLQYISRPQTAEIFFEDIRRAIHFYGMPVLVESNKQRLLYYLKNKGYRAFSLNRPDKHASKLSFTEKELGGIPSASEDILQAHASFIESYIEKYVGIDTEGIYRGEDEMGNMYFNETLHDWLKFDIRDRTKHDASISSGLAIMATSRHTFKVEQERKKITIGLPIYNQNGNHSRRVK
jgi:hypothetical protein